MSELARFLRNTAFTGAAFLFSGLVGLLLVPVLIGAYGIATYGLLMLARTLLPAGILAVLDLGIGESATQAVARARGNGDWRNACEQLSLLFLAGIAVGALLGLGLTAGAPALARLFRVDEAVSSAFVRMLQLTGASLLVLFPGLVIEGVVRGFERFGLLRLCESATTLAYALVAVALAWRGQPFETNQYAFLAALGVRYVALGIGVWREARRAGLGPVRWSTDTSRYLRLRAVLFFQSKLTAALHTFAPALVVGALVGPAGVGLYDVITRLPRFLKPVLSILTSAIVPVAARFEGAGDAQRLRQVGAVGFWLIPLVALPPLTAMMAFADVILAAWIGPEYGRYGPWLGVALIAPVFLVALQFGQSALQIHSEFLRSVNRLAAGMVLVQYAFSLALVTWLEERAFILGQCAAIALFFPANVTLLARSFGLAPRWAGAELLRVASPALFLAPLALIPHGSAALAIGLFVLWCLVYWFACYGWLLADDQRHFLRRVCGVLLR